MRAYKRQTGCGRRERKGGQAIVCGEAGRGRPPAGVGTVCSEAQARAGLRNLYWRELQTTGSKMSREGGGALCQREGTQAGSD